MRGKIVVSLARRNLHVRYGSNTGHGFAAEAQRRNGKDIFDRTDFARAVTDDALMGIFWTHAATVVSDPHIGLAAIGDFHFNGMGTGINGISTNSLIHDAGRSTTSPAAILLRVASSKT